MSRSYKKYPVTRQDKVDKKYYNRKLRRLQTDIAYLGGQYRKIYICDDWKYPWYYKEAVRQYMESDKYPNKQFPTLESWLEYWKRCTLRK